MKIITLFVLLLFSLYANDKACLSCHKEHAQNFATSHHALAMQEANAKSVLGNFNNATFDYNGIISTFFKKGNTFMVTTDNEHGKLQTYEIAYTFGVYPLQQYMIKFPQGRVQVLDIAWDSRDKKEGGQRWFHIHKDDNVTAGDVLHWTGPNFNWNFMCADCHSTNLQKNYDPKTKSYNTKYDNITLSCASCHGNGNEHLQWAKNPKGFKGKHPKGLAIELKKNRWAVDPKSGKVSLEGKIDRSEVEMCAQCHSRRAQLDNHYQPGKKFDNHYLLSQLDENLYFSNGAIKDEVYEIGSFRQSKMYDAGVTCSDCHDVHSLSRSTLNAGVCNKCHQESKYTSSAHTRHATNAKNVNCITCHMPSRTYMGVDERNDHSFRIPRPDLSINSDNPNACNQCHKDKDAQWANDAMIQWYGKIPTGHQNYTHALEALRTNSEQAPQFLYDVIMSNAPSLAKATATEYLGDTPSQQTYTTTLQMLRNSNSDIRLSALRALETFPMQMRTQPTLTALSDTAKIVRIEAARQLSALPQEEMDQATRRTLNKGISEYKESLIYNSDRAESQVALAGLYANMGERGKAIEAYEEALRMQPKLVPAIINYAQFYQNSDDIKSLKILEQGLKHLPNEATLYYAKGLWEIRHKHPDKALLLLEKAATMEPKNGQFQYVYAVAVGEKDPKKAIDILKKSLHYHSGDIQALYGVAFYCNQTGQTQEGQKYQERADKLAKFIPRINYQQ